MSQERFVIYCRTCRSTGLEYVGQVMCQTSKTPEAALRGRWGRDGKGYIKNRHLYGAISMYGGDAFAHTVLEVVVGRIDADKAEAHWIKKLKTLWPRGYNLRSGGGKARAHHETRKKMSESGKRRWAKVPRAEVEEHMRILQAAAAKSKTPEQIREFAQKACAASAARPPEQRSASARTRDAAMTREQLQQRGRYFNTLTPEQRREMALKASASKTPEERSESARKREASKTPEQRSERARRGNASMTPEQRSERTRRGMETRRAKKDTCPPTEFVMPSAKYLKLRP